MNPEADEIHLEDLEAAAEFYDALVSSNPAPPPEEPEPE